MANTRNEAEENDEEVNEDSSEDSEDESDSEGYEVGSKYKDVPLKWEATIKIRVHKIAFSTPYDQEVYRGPRTFNPEWLKEVEDDAGRKIYKVFWNPGKRLKGWIVEQSATLYGTRSDKSTRMKSGLFVKTIGYEEEVPIANAVDLIGDTRFRPDEKGIIECEGAKYILGKLPVFPKHEFVKVRLSSKKTESKASFWVELLNPIDVELRVTCWAKGINPADIKKMLEEIGPNIGLGDKHALGQNGLFDLIEFSEPDYVKF
jgi:hypothetical protein